MARELLAHELDLVAGGVSGPISHGNVTATLVGNASFGLANLPGPTHSNAPPPLVPGVGMDTADTAHA